MAGGGFAAYDYILSYRERVRILVIAAIGGAITDEELRQLRQKTALLGFATWPPEFREVSTGYTATKPEGLKRWLEIHHHSQQKGAPVQPNALRSRTRSSRASGCQRCCDPEYAVKLPFHF